MRVPVLAIGSFLLSQLLLQASALGYYSETAYMACSILDQGNRASILAVPYSTDPASGREMEIVVRSCDTDFACNSTGCNTVFDCTKQVTMLKMILRQLQKSKMCPTADL